MPTFNLCIRYREGHPSIRWILSRALAIKMITLFGVNVGNTEMTAQSMSQSHLESGDVDKFCVCGLQYNGTQINAQGTYTYTCPVNGSSHTKDWEVTSLKLVDGKARTQWRACKLKLPPTIKWPIHHSALMICKGIMKRDCKKRKYATIGECI